MSINNNNNFYNELQNIAAQSMPVSQTKSDGIDSALSKQEIEKLNTSTKLATEMYPEDQASRFDFWKKQNNTTLMNPITKDVYWKIYETMHPEGIVGAKRDFIDVTKREIDYIDSNVGKEFFLRERLDNTPAWARKELEPILGELSANVANSNYSKAQQVYMKDLDLRISSFSARSQLDPDISIDSHTADAVRLEQLNLLELAKVQEGRIGVYNEKGQFYPAFGIKDRNEIFDKDPYGSPSIQEQSVIRNLSPNIIRKAIEGNLAVNRNKIQADERVSTNIASEYLTTGAFNMDQWDTVFAMLPNISIYDKIKLGIQGEVKAGRLKTEKDLVRAIYQTMVRYGSYLETKEQK